MSQVSYRANLSAASFPLLSEFQGQTIIVKQQDQNYVSAIESGVKDDTPDIGIPQLYYGHNVLPNAQGFGSVAYNFIVNSVNNQNRFDSIFILRDSSENKAYFSHALDGTNYILLPGAINWLQINTIAATAGVVVTTANINGLTYIYFAGVGCYRFDFALSQLVPVTLTGLSLSTVRGITTTAGYMIAWTATGIAWSSTVSPTDFVPSLTTGAGGGSVEGAKGSIQVCVSAIGAFVVYTTNNAIIASYSGNARYPFNFKEIVGSGGLANPELVVSDGNSGAQYAYTTYGIQSVGIQIANTILPEITDFIAGSYFEDFDESTLTFTQTVLTTTMKKKLTLVSSRYLILSYGISSLTHAIVYDIALKRYGKLKINHVDCFEYNLLNPEVIESPKKSIAFLQNDGKVFLVDSTFAATSSFGVMILGKYQYIRQRMMAMDTVLLENIRTTNFFKLYDMPALDGKNATVQEGYLLESTNLFRKYGFGQDMKNVGLNHGLLFVGGFYAVSLELNFHVHGRL